jgi:hypothetical protein
MDQSNWLIAEENVTYVAGPKGSELSILQNQTSYFGDPP